MLSRAARRVVAQSAGVVQTSQRLVAPLSSAPGAGRVLEAKATATSGPLHVVEMNVYGEPSCTKTYLVLNTLTYVVPSALQNSAPSNRPPQLAPHPLLRHQTFPDLPAESLEVGFWAAQRRDAARRGLFSSPPAEWTERWKRAGLGREWLLGGEEVVGSVCCACSSKRLEVSADQQSYLHNACAGSGR
jgi:hypothetical protein